MMKKYLYLSILLASTKAFSFDTNSVLPSEYFNESIRKRLLELEDENKKLKKEIEAYKNIIEHKDKEIEKLNTLLEEVVNI